MLTNCVQYVFIYTPNIQEEDKTYVYNYIQERLCTKNHVHVPHLRNQVEGVESSKSREMVSGCEYW
jgi:hypothetical protein